MVCALILPTSASAAGFAPTASSFSNLAALISNQVVTAIVEGIGLGTDYRSYEGASVPSGLLGLDIGVEAGIAALPNDFVNALHTAGYTKTVPLFIPIARLHVHKTLGERVSIEAALLQYHQYKILGGGMKIVLYAPEEGVTWAFRTSYSHSSLDILKTSTITPQLVISKKLLFAEPYLGVGYQFTSGKIDLAVPVAGTTVDLTSSARVSAFESYLGVQFNVGLQITLEGGYSSRGESTLGTKIGVRF